VIQRSLLGLLPSLVALSAVLAASLSAGAAPPNVVIILADDLGWGSLGCYGADPALIRTPNIDRLAREGRRFTDASTTSSVCSPTRYSLLTGRYCWRTSLGREVLNYDAPLHIEPGRLNLASMLKRRGYRTSAIGKWHLGYGVGKTDYTRPLRPGPIDVGFDDHFGVPSNHGDVAGVFLESSSRAIASSGSVPRPCDRGRPGTGGTPRSSASTRRGGWTRR
jgi:arylsulfatase A-like enzyme